MEEFTREEKDCIIDNCFNLIESDYLGDEELTKQNLNAIEVSKKTFYMIKPTEIKILIKCIMRIQDLER